MARTCIPSRRRLGEGPPANPLVVPPTTLAVSGHSTPEVMMMLMLMLAVNRLSPQGRHTGSLPTRVPQTLFGPTPTRPSLGSTQTRLPSRLVMQLLCCQSLYQASHSMHHALAKHPLYLIYRAQNNFTLTRIQSPNIMFHAHSIIWQYARQRRP